MDITEILKDSGWSDEGIKFLQEKSGHQTIRKFFFKLQNQKYKPPRKPAKPKKHISAKIRKAVFERDAYRCVQCGDWHNLSIDHIVPESKGGTLELSNLQTLCITCNCRKGNRV